MNTNRSQRRFVTLLAVAGLALLAVGGVAGWLAWRSMSLRQGSAPAAPTAAPASAEDMERFYIGLAALDVEANERALKEFQSLSQSLPSEPAVWANLGIAWLRLSDNSAATEALTKAAELAPDNRQISLLQALVEELSGEFERAIERLKQIPDPEPAALYSLALLVERTGKEASLVERLDLINRILKREPENAVAQFQRARLAARLEDGPQLADALQALAQRRSEWTAVAAKQFEAADRAARAKRFNDAAKALTFMENVSRASPAYQEALVSLGNVGGSVGTPMRRFLAVAEQAAALAAADLQLTFQPRSEAEPAPEGELVLAAVLSSGAPATRIRLEGTRLFVGTDIQLTFPRGDATRPVGRDAVLPVDLNGDFRQDLALVGPEGLRIYLQDDQGQFAPWVPGESERDFLQPAGDGVWALDYEADGDLDLLVARDEGPPQLLRNNGDMTFTAIDALSHLPAPRELYWCDLDNDGDVDLAVLDRSGGLLVAWNERAGQFSPPVPLTLPVPVVACAVGDIDRDGVFDLAALAQDGVVHQFSYDALRRKWSQRALVTWSAEMDLEALCAQRRTSLWLADLDNNGALDLAASAGSHTAIWLQEAQARFQPLAHAPSLFVTSVADADGDGRLDLTGWSPDGGRTLFGGGALAHHWQVIQPHATPGGGDQRINSFGLGGRIEVRAGQSLQVALIDGPLVHIGLGSWPRAGVARIVWPNGTAQAEFDLAAGQTITAQQRLKGSCPFVFARNDNGYTFVKDFIWRSPLGLKINSQDTAGVTQTEDWIKIPGELLTPQHGVHDVRITAELWETHFFDHVALLVADHPETVEVFVDERFVAARSPALEVVPVTPPKPLRRVLDDSGRDVAAELSAIDGDYVDSFALGRFQGIAAEHWLEFELDESLPDGQVIYLVGTGWVYPTDSSLNVAISQGDHPRPHGLILEAPQSDGGWHAVSDDLGFPAGKNKTVLIPLPEALLRAGQRRFRLRTNLEVYWDALGWAARVPDENVRTRRIEATSAQMRYRGFSELTPLDRRKPDLPLYNRLASHAPRWRDLEGYYTHFGDVRELLEAVDDRYVIMNAGDEILMQFAATDPPPPGWKRDYVLIGDGWVKDGDYNTTHSRTVHPLPTHASPDYSQAGGTLWEDPLFQKHLDDWREYHTRYVTPRHFARGLWQTDSPVAVEDDE